MATGDLPFRGRIAEMIRAINKDPTPKLPDAYRCFDRILGRFENKIYYRN